MKVTRKQLRRYLGKLLNEAGASLAGVSSISTPSGGTAGYGRTITYDPNVTDEMVDALVNVIAAPGAESGNIGESILYAIISAFKTQCAAAINTNKWAFTNAQQTLTGLGVDMSSAIGGLGDSYAVDLWCGPDPMTQSFTRDSWALAGEGISMKMSTTMTSGTKVYQNAKLTTDKETLQALGYAFGRSIKTNPVIANYYIPNTNAAGTWINLTDATVATYITNQASKPLRYTQIQYNSTPGISSAIKGNTRQMTAGRRNLKINGTSVSVHMYAWEAFKSVFIANNFKSQTISAKFSGVNGTLVPIDVANNPDLTPLVAAGAPGVGSENIPVELTQHHLLNFLESLFLQNPSLDKNNNSDVEAAIRTWTPTDFERDMPNASGTFFGTSGSNKYRLGMPSVVRAAVASGTVTALQPDRLNSLRMWFGDAYKKLQDFFTVFNPEVKMQFDSTQVYTFALTINNYRVKQQRGTIISEELNCTYSGSPTQFIPAGSAGYNIKELEINLGQAVSTIRKIPWMQMITQASKSIIPTTVASEQQNLLNALRSVVAASDNTIRLTLILNPAGIPVGTAGSRLQRLTARNKIEMSKIEDAVNLIQQITTKIQFLPGQTQAVEIDAVLDELAEYYEAKEYVDAFEAYFTYLQSVLEDPTYAKSSASNAQKAEIAQEILNFKTFMGTIASYIDLSTDTLYVIDHLLAESGLPGKSNIESLLEFVKAKDTVDSLQAQINMRLNKTNDERVKFLHALNSAILQLMKINQLIKSKGLNDKFNVIVGILFDDMLNALTRIDYSLDKTIVNETKEYSNVLKALIKYSLN